MNYNFVRNIYYIFILVYFAYNINQIINNKKDLKNNKNGLLLVEKII